jgi:hypothetical protein
VGDSWEAWIPAPAGAIELLGHQLLEPAQQVSGSGDAGNLPIP